MTGLVLVLSEFIKAWPHIKYRLIILIEEYPVTICFSTPFVVYPFAWSGHFFFEKNKPAAWSKPLWAKACDWVMLKDMIIGKVKR